MRRLGMLILSVALLSVWPIRASADVWELDSSVSVVRFTYDHFGLSRQSGQFRDITGTLQFSPTDPERGEVEVTVKATALTTGSEPLDRLLKSPDFFDVGRQPLITFKSTGVSKTGERTGELRGDLTLLGVTQPITLTVRWNYTGEYPLSSINPAYIGKWVSGFSASGVIQRSQWGMQRGIPLLSDDIELSIEVEFLRVAERSDKLP